MSRALFIWLAVAVASASAAYGAFVWLGDQREPKLTEEQRLTRSKFFGTTKELPPIEKGQEMRPRW